MKVIFILKSVFTSPRVLAAVFLIFLMTISSIGPAISQTVLQGYKSEDQLQRGMLVSLDPKDQSKIIAITDQTLTELKGVVVDQSESSVTLSSEEDEIFVATSGSYEVLVSDENGEIVSGDLISGSSMSGVAAKATDAQAVILGRAIDSSEGKETLGKTLNNKGQSVSFSRIMVDIGVGANPILKPQEKESVPSVIERIASEVAGKQVSAAKVYLALTILIVTTLIAGATLFSGVRSAVISIGRNPLSRGIIYKGLIQVGLLSFIIFITGLFAVYLLIKL